MRILFALPYGPTTTRVRSRMLLEQLSQRHEITLLGLAWNDDDRAAMRELARAGIDVRIIDHGRAAQLRGFAGDPRRPLQQMISTSQPFARAARQLIADARNAGRPYAAVHVEHFRGAAAIDLFQGIDARVVYDAVDCLAALAKMTAENGPSWSVRQIARVEERSTRAAETRLLAMADAVTVVAERDRREMAGPGNWPQLQVIPNGVQPRPIRPHIPSEPVAIFSGKLSYHANQAAVRWFLEHVWPRVIASRPNARFVVAGAEPPAWMRRLELPSVEVIANPPDLLDLIGQARVAVAPMTYSVGIQNKVLEAMACAVPVVTTTVAAEGLLKGHARGFLTADQPAAFADALLHLLNDDASALAMGKQGHDYVTRCHSWEATARQFEDLYVSASSVIKVA